MYNNNNNSNLPSTPSSSLSFDSNNGNVNNNGQIPQLWMGELDQRWDELTIKQIWTSLLSNLGIVVHSVKLIKDKQSSQLGLANAGYCFIRFHNFEDASKVLNNFNGKPIPGTNNQHYFRLNWSSANIQAAAVAAAANSSIPLTTSSNPIEYSIFVGDLPQNINEQILLQTFKMKYPSCTSVKIMVDQSTGNIKGYGFVKFLNEDEQKKALVEMQGYILLGRAIRVSTASKSNSSLPNSLSNNSNSSLNINQVLSPSKLLSTNFSNPSTQLSQQSQQIYSQQPLLQQSNLSISSSLPNNITSNTNNPTNNNNINNSNNRSLLQPLPQNNSLQYFNDPANTTVFIGGLNVPFTEKQMFDLFSKYGSISYVKIPAGKNCGFVQFFHRESAEMAINEMQGYDIGGGCKIRVSWGARAAQRSWFARQLQMQQQAQQVQQLPINNFNNSNSNSNNHLNQLSNNDISMLLNMTKNQNITENLGLFDSYSNININDPMLNLNSYSIDQYNFQNEQIPFTNNNNPNVVSSDTVDSTAKPNNNNNNNNNTNFNSNDELKLNKLLLAARDGNLDQLDLGSNIYN